MLGVGEIKCNRDDSGGEGLSAFERVKRIIISHLVQILTYFHEIFVTEHQTKIRLMLYLSHLTRAEIHIKKNQFVLILILNTN